MLNNVSVLKFHVIDTKISDTFILLSTVNFIYDTNKQKT